MTTAIEPAGEEILRLLLCDKRSPRTRQAYAADLRDFFHGEPLPGQVREFVGRPAPDLARALALYKAALRERGLSEATMNRRLAAVRSLLKFCYRLGYSQSDGRNLVESERVIPYRDTRGISAEAVRRLFAAQDASTLIGLRNLALLRLLCENALRRNEICTLDVGDFRPAESLLYVLGKGHGSQKEPETLSDRGVTALCRYLAAATHSTDPTAPLLCSLDAKVEGAGRLTGEGVYHIVTEMGRRAGIAKLNPHRLRHTSLTIALDVTGGDVRAVRDLSRHASLETLQRYDDNRRNLQGAVSAKLSEVF